MDRRLEVRKFRNAIYGVHPRLCPSRKNLVLILPEALEIYSARIKFYVNVFPWFPYSIDISYLKPTLAGLWLILCIFRDFPNSSIINQRPFYSCSDAPSQTSTKHIAHWRCRFSAIIADINHFLEAQGCISCFMWAIYLKPQNCCSSS